MKKFKCFEILKMSEPVKFNFVSESHVSNTQKDKSF